MRRILPFCLLLCSTVSTAAFADDTPRPDTGADWPALCAGSALAVPTLDVPVAVAKAAAVQPRTGSFGATVTAVLTGFVLPGSGHFAAGDRKTGRRLLLLGAAGAGLAAAGAATVLYTNGNRHVSQFGIPLLVSGVGVLGASWLADIYGAATGGVTRGERAPARASVTAGYGHVSDPQFSYAHFAVAEARFELGRLSVLPSLWAAADADNQRARLMARYALWRNSRDSHFSIEVGGTNHRFGTERFTTRVFESALTSRFNLGLFGPRLSGAFALVSAGFGYQTIDFDIEDTPSTGSTLLIGRVGFGARVPAGGEIQFYYDHRRDDFAGGLSPSRRRGSGFAGHIGLAHRQPLGQKLSLRLMAEFGSAWVFASALEAHWGRTQ